MADDNQEYPAVDILEQTTNLNPVWGTTADDVTEIPYLPTEETNVSQSSLFPIEYSKDPVAGGEFISRSVFNGILKTITMQAQVYSGWRQGAPYDHDFCTTRGYPLGARLTILLDNVTHTLTTVKLLKEAIQSTPELTYLERRTLCDSIIIESQLEDNKHSALEFANLFKYWKVIDGNPLLALKMMGADGYPVPGYLDLGAIPKDGETEPEYLLTDYPRVASLLKLNDGNVCTFFKKKGSDKFTTVDLRGLFTRVFNNNSIETGKTPRDPGRSFNEIQNYSMAPIIGAFSLLGYTSYGGDSYGSPQDQVIKARTFMAVDKIPTKYQDDPKYAHFRELGKFNCCRPVNFPTNYMLSSDSYQAYGPSYSTITYDKLKTLTGDTLLIDTSDHPNVSYEVRPKNFCHKLYIKV